MERVPAAVHAVSGAVGSSVANILLYPLDVVIVRQQIQRDTDSRRIADKQRLRTLNASEETQDEAAPEDDSDEKPPPSTIELFRSILKTEGWAALFEGAADDTIAAAAQSFLYFFVYDYLRNQQLRYHRRRRGFVPQTLGIRQELFFGAVAGMVCKLFTTPIKNVVILKQIEHSDKRRTVAQCLKEIVANKGVFGLWSGYRATFFLSANPSLAYYFYQKLGSSHKADSTLRVFVRAAIAKSLATILTYPVILEKTRTQAKPGPSDLYRDLWKTFQHHGFVGLYDGVNGQLVKGCFSQGITMTSKESISRFVVYVYIHILRKQFRRRTAV